MNQHNKCGWKKSQLNQSCNPHQKHLVEADRQNWFILKWIKIKDLNQNVKLYLSMYQNESKLKIWIKIKYLNQNESKFKEMNQN